jgi:alpha-galactosidase
VYIDIDDCWQAYNRSAGGEQIANATLFPSGMKSLADWLHARGFKLGLYSDAGTATCQKRAGSLGYEEKDAATYASWGVDLLKYDTCNQPAGTDPKVVYPKMGRALNATGRDIWYMMCEWGHADPAIWAADLALANSWRTGNDLMPLFPSFMQVAEGNSRWWQYSTPGHYNDPGAYLKMYLKQGLQDKGLCT